ncbi:hypothetical protein DEO72_LG10g2273 [Vigna unguiculata]|uniref:Uncharacterized protein n=1 Tax=Vigna unguiculata TaxID=3917 RepID=A0A4D6NAX3_VIGUN|nr:hypothetical protein DEO72_LG10g2273 [Vigna unguiculata]
MSTFSSSESTESERSKDRLLGDEGTSSMAGTSGMPVEVVREVREDPPEELEESNWPAKGGYGWVVGDVHDQSSLFRWSRLLNSWLNCAPVISKGVSGGIVSLEKVSAIDRPTPYAFLYFYDTRPQWPVTWLSLISRPSISRLDAFSQSFKHFKDRYFKVVVKEGGKSHFLNADGSTKFPFSWTNNPSRYKDMGVEELSAGDKEVVGMLLKFVDKLPTKDLVRVYNSVHPIIDIEGHMAQSGKKNLALFQSLRKEMAAKAKAAGKADVPNLQESVVEVHVHGGTKRKAELPPRPGKGKDVKKIRAALLGTASGAGSASGEKGPEAGLIELLEISVRKDISIDLPDTVVNSINNMNVDHIVRTMVEFGSKALVLSWRVWYTSPPALSDMSCRPRVICFNVLAKPARCDTPVPQPLSISSSDSMSTFSSSESTESERSKDRLLGDEGTSSMAGTSGMPVEVVREVREDPPEELEESNWPAKGGYGWVVGDVHDQSSLFRWSRLLNSWLNCAPVISKGVSGGIVSLEKVSAIDRPTPYAFLYFYDTRPQWPVTWLSLISRPSISRLDAFSQSFKHFKDRYFKVVVKEGGKSHFLNADGSTKFPFSWTNNPSRYKDMGVEELSAGDKEVVGMLLKFVDKLPTKDLVRVYNSVHPIIDIEGHMAQSGKKNLALFQSLRKEMAAKAKAAGKADVPNLQESVVEVHVHGGTKRKAELPPRPGKGKDVKKIRAALLGTASGAGSASGEKGPEAGLIELLEISVRKDISIDLPDTSLGARP